jgi:hypothetical protein
MLFLGPSRPILTCHHRSLLAINEPVGKKLTGNGDVESWCWFRACAVPQDDNIVSGVGLIFIWPGATLRVYLSRRYEIYRGILRMNRTHGHLLGLLV